MPDTPRPAVRPAGRYGDDRRGRTGLWIAAGTLMAVIVAWSAWVALGIARQPVHWSDAIGVQRDAGHLELSFQVTMQPGHRAVCTVEALSSGFGQVGLMDVPVGPSPRSTVTVNVLIPTSEPAVSGNVKACALA